MSSSSMSRSAVHRAATGLATAAVLGGVLVGIGAGSATASTTQHGICNGVLNQASRGSVQPNLLTAAAKQNAAVIRRLQADRAALVAQSGVLTSQITAAQDALADLD